MIWAPVTTVTVITTGVLESPAEQPSPVQFSSLQNPSRKVVTHPKRAKLISREADYTFRFVCSDLFFFSSFNSGTVSQNEIIVRENRSCSGETVGLEGILK